MIALPANDVDSKDVQKCMTVLKNNNFKWPEIGLTSGQICGFKVVVTAEIEHPFLKVYFYNFALLDFNETWHMR